MIDPATGIRSVTTIQLKLVEGADLNEVRDALRSVEFLGLKGPGAEEIGSAYALLVRGITIEVWSLASGERTAVLHGPDEG